MNDSGFYSDFPCRGLPPNMHSKYETTTQRTTVFYAPPPPDLEGWGEGGRSPFALHPPPENWLRGQNHYFSSIDPLHVYKFHKSIDHGQSSIGRQPSRDHFDNNPTVLAGSSPVGCTVSFFFFSFFLFCFVSSPLFFKLGD